MMQFIVLAVPAQNEIDKRSHSVKVDLELSRHKMLLALGDVHT
jgi:hypothetical protein